MKPKLTPFSYRYLKALRGHLQPGSQAGEEQPTMILGREAAALGIKTPELAWMHKQALSSLKLSPHDHGLLERAERFFSTVAGPLFGPDHTRRRLQKDLNRLKRTLGRRTLELAATHRQLKRGVIRRKNMEAALKKNGLYYGGLLKNSLRLQEDLRRLTHQVLAAQEVERKKISVELQDGVAQTLLGIRVRLFSLKHEARTNTRGLKRNIAGTHRLVASSVKSVRRVARELSSL